MRLPRPYIPLSVRVQVAERQLGDSWSIKGQTRTEYLDLLLRRLFPDRMPFHLDHDPALENRTIIRDHDGEFLRYEPDANDPRHLIYRTAQDHKIKTLVRGDGAQLSDAAIARKRKRIVRKSDPKRRVAKIPARVNPWPKGRKLRSRRK